MCCTVSEDRMRASTLCCARCGSRVPSRTGLIVNSRLITKGAVCVDLEPTVLEGVIVELNRQQRFHHHGGRQTDAVDDNRARDRGRARVGVWVSMRVRDARRWTSTKPTCTQTTMVLLSSSLSCSSLLMVGWLWRDNQGYRQMSHANPSGISLFLIGCLMTARRCRMESEQRRMTDERTRTYCWRHPSQSR